MPDEVSTNTPKRHRYVLGPLVVTTTVTYRERYQPQRQSSGLREMASVPSRAGTSRSLPSLMYSWRWAVRPRSQIHGAVAHSLERGQCLRISSLDDVVVLDERALKWNTGSIA